MKKPVLALVAVLVVVDAAALFFYLKHKDRPAPPQAPAAPAPAAPEPAPAPAPEPTPAAEPDSGGGFTTPGDCKSAEDCAAYCADAAHQAECRDFLGSAAPEPERPAPPPRVEPKQGEEGGAPLGPGGCRSEEECGRFCGNPANAAECRGFARKERARLIALIKASRPATRACLSKAVGKGPYERFLAGKEDVTPEFGQAMQTCFKAADAGADDRRPNKGKREPGPGGCRGGQACMQYCSQPENAEECLAWKDLPAQFRPMLQKLVGEEGGGEGDDGAGE